MSNKDRFSNAIEKLRKINEDNKNNLNEIIKEKEMSKIKEEEKKKFITIINKCDKTLNLVRKENKELMLKGGI